LAAPKTKINMGVGGYTNTGPLEEGTYTAVFVKGRKGDVIARDPDGKIILPRSKRIKEGSVWVGKLVDKGRYYLFYPLRPLTPVDRRDGDFLITSGGALVQTPRGAVLLPRGQRWGDFKKIAQDVGRHRHSGALLVSGRFARGVAAAQDLEGFTFKAQKDPEKCGHKWVNVDRSGGFDILACPACGAHRYREPVKSATPSKSRARRHPVGRGGLSTKGMHRRRVVHARKRKGVL